MKSIIAASNKTAGLLALSVIKGVGPKSLLALIQDGFDFERMDPESLQSRSGKWQKLLSEDAWSSALHAAVFQLESALDHGVRFISILDNEYPAILKRMESPPLLLQSKGDFSLLDGLRSNPAAGVLGARRPTRRGQVITERLTTYLNNKPEMLIVTTDQSGCDDMVRTAAHRSIVVSAFSLDQISVTDKNTLHLSPVLFGELQRVLLSIGIDWSQAYVR